MQQTNDTVIKKDHAIEDLIADFDKLLCNLNKILEEIKPKTNIKSTKLWRIRQDIEKISDLTPHQAQKLCEIIAKYNSINLLFDNKSVAYNKGDLIKIIEGSADYTKDSAEHYTDTLFELSMGARFASSPLLDDYDKKINLKGPCDIIINNLIAIECKYIHSKSNLEKNIQKARRQIEKRVRDKEASFGIIAIDLSNVSPKEKIKSFANFVLDEFICMYEKINFNEAEDKGILHRIISDKNYYKIISAYEMTQIETIFFSEVSPNYNFGEDVLAILIQSNNSITLEHKNEMQICAARGMTYRLTKDFSQQDEITIKKIIHSLTVGI